MAFGPTRHRAWVDGARSRVALRLHAPALQPSSVQDGHQRKPGHASHERRNECGPRRGDEWRPSRARTPPEHEAHARVHDRGPQEALRVQARAPRRQIGGLGGLGVQKSSKNDGLGGLGGSGWGSWGHLGPKRRKRRPKGAIWWILSFSSWSPCPF